MKTIENKINFKLYASLLFLGLCPAIYNTFRVYLIGQIPGEWSYSIAGQLSWVNLLYEILYEAIVLPVVYFMGKVVNQKEEFENRVKTGLFGGMTIYCVLSILLCLFIHPILNTMAVNKEIMNESAIYIRIESVAKIFNMMFQFLLVALIVIGKSKHVYFLTISQLVLSIITDFFLFSNSKISLKMGINGVGISNIIINAVLLVITIAILNKENICIFSKKKPSFTWFKEFAIIGSISGVESFVRNIAYMLMISRMINVVSEQGTYWLANGFIWGWLLLPINALAELIKQEVSIDKSKTIKPYLEFTGLICGIWIISIPLWKLFMKNILAIQEYEKVFELVFILVWFYIGYAFQNVVDSVFYGKGKTIYMLFESIMTNCIYYGTAYIAYLNNLWSPTLKGIALLFGFGVLFDSIVSFIAYYIFTKKRKQITK